MNQQQQPEEEVPPEMQEASDETETDPSEEMQMDSEEKPPATPDPTMILADQERTWALAIKEAIATKKDLKPISDMECAQFAICCNGDLEQALHRIEAMQIFRDYYQVNPLDVDQCVSCLRAMMDQQPEFLLHVDCDPDRNDSINVVDVGSFDPHLALGLNQKGVENWNVFVRGIYFMKHCCQPTLMSIRNGHFVLADFAEMDQFNRFVPEVQIRLFTEVFQWFPFLAKQFYAYNTGYVATLKLTLAKKLMPAHLQNTVQLGCTIDESDESRTRTHQLKEFYLQPNLELAQQNLLNRAATMLTRRAYNDKRFRL